jgi:hypothetical protein
MGSTRTHVEQLHVCKKMTQASLIPVYRETVSMCTVEVSITTGFLRPDASEFSKGMGMGDDPKFPDSMSVLI